MYIQIFLQLDVRTLPVSSCEAERSFSGLRRIKTFLRSSMSIERLAGLALMHLYNDLDIDEDKICQLFISKHHRRMFLLCLLFESANVYILVFILHVTVKFFV